jgi:hypothetical protein
MVMRRKRIAARILDVSEGGLCLLSPIALKPKQTILLRIEVPPRGPVEVEAITWHVRRLKGRTASTKTWSIGMMISKAGDGFQALLPNGRVEGAGYNGAADELSSKLAELSSRSDPSPPPESDEIALEEDQLSAAELEDVGSDLASPAELEDVGSDLASPAELESLALESQESSSNGKPHVFRVRIKASGGSRTRVLSLNAPSKAEAEELARADLDDSWVIIEVVPA